MTHLVKRAAQVAVLSAVFAGGYLCGSVAQRSADAQMGDVGGALGGAAMKQAGESGGALGTAAKLGTTITDMQQQVTGLQKNLDTLNQIKAALGG